MTPTITLHEVEDRDLLIFFAQQQDPEATRLAAFPARDHDAFMAHWAKVRVTETALVRTILLGPNVAGHICSWTQDGARNLGYWLGREYWGRGIASAAVAQFLTIDRARPLVAHVVKHNHASLRVLQKSGFRISGEHSFADTPDEEFILTLDIL